MAKFYAVRKGRHIGIFNTWDACKKEVMGFSGAEYKSFPDRQAAEEYIKSNAQISLFDDEKQSLAVAYCDGSYNISTAQFSYGLIIFYNGNEYTFSKAFTDSQLASMRNVAGEIEGAKAAMQYCADNNIPALELYYDYAGIEKWCTGEWKTNKVGTISYKAFYDEIKNKVKVSFNKVKGHSGDEQNDKVDRLAKDVLGIK